MFLGSSLRIGGGEGDAPNLVSTPFLEKSEFESLAQIIKSNNLQML